MEIWFLISLIGFVAVISPYFLSIEHLKLKEKYGNEKGKKIGEILGIVSGWGFFLFWFGIWFSPQDSFATLFLQNFLIQIPFTAYNLNIVNLVIFLPFFIVGAWFGIKGGWELNPLQPCDFTRITHFFYEKI